MLGFAAMRVDRFGNYREKLVDVKLIDIKVGDDPVEQFVDVLWNQNT